MVRERLIHDSAFAMQQAIMDRIQHCFREEERLDLATELYVICKAGIEAYELQLNRMIQRLNPTKN